MERRPDLEKAKQLFGVNFIGIDELSAIADKLGIQVPLLAPELPYSQSELELHSKDCILILGIEKMIDGKGFTLMNLREKFGTDSLVSEPSFYNQDWYLKEKFITEGLENRWYLIKKSVFEDSRAVLPNLLETKYKFPNALLCAYAFFVFWFHENTILWKFDFVWCSDTDHNGDRIYVGKYADIDGVNKNGFSIHRHLALRDSYACISIY